MHQITFNNKHYTCPEKWDEVTAPQLLLIAPILLKLKTRFIQLGGEMSTEEFDRFRILLFIGLCGFKARAAAKLEAEHLHFVLYKNKALDFMMKNNGFTHQIFPKIQIRVSTFYGPATELKNITGDEFAWAEINYRLYIDTKLPSHLDNLIATLYRPAALFNRFLKTLGVHYYDVRKTFCHTSIEHRSRKISHAPETVKQSILLWYEGCREFIIQTYPDCFKGDPNSSDKRKGTFIDVNLMLARTQVFGPYNITVKENLHLLLRHLNNMMTEKPTKASKNSNE